MRAQREIIFFLQKEGASGAEIVKRLKNVFKDRSLNKTAVYKWMERFSEDENITCKDAERTGRPRTSTAAETCEKVEQLIMNERRITVSEIAYQCDVSVGSAHDMIKSLGFSKLSARWVPRLLTLEMKEKRCQTSFENLKVINARGSNFFDRLITVDEAWFHQFEVETKMQSKQWCRQKENPPLKPKQIPSMSKVMVTVFFDSEGIILLDFLDKGATINTDYYCGLLRRMREQLWRKRPGKMALSPILLQDNARPHVSKRSLETITEIGLQTLSHPPYSPDLSPCDYFLFPIMKKPLRGRKFADLDELKMEIKRWCRNQKKEFFADGMKKLQERYEKCVRLQGDYVEKCDLKIDSDE